MSAKPNIVFVLADDLGWTDLGCYGSRFYETPNIDRLAAMGIRFTRFYMCPNCTPSRAALMSGQYPTRTGMYTVGSLARGQDADRKLAVPANVLNLPMDRNTIADQLKAAGYATGLFGKWHIGETPEFHPSHRGFDEAIATMGRHFNFETVPPVEHAKDAYLADWLTDQSLDFIQRHRNGPFFLYLSHFAPHTPYQAKPELVKHFRSKPPVDGQNSPEYAAMIASLDESVGRIMRALDRLGIANNTMLIFASDNGGVGGYGNLAFNITDNSPLRGGKGMLYEGGIRVPLIVRWPGITRGGTKCDVPAAHVDFFPTFLEVAHAPKPTQVLDGVSLVPLLHNPSANLNRQAICEHLPGYLEGTGSQWRSTPASAIIVGDWKLIHFYEDNRNELYNVREDIGEKRDMVSRMPDRKKSLWNRLSSWLKETGAKMPIPRGTSPAPASRRPSERQSRNAAPCHRRIPNACG